MKYVITDGVKVMVKFGQLIMNSPELSHVKHTTCIVHWLNLLCEIIRNKYTIINDLVAGIKITLNNNNSNKVLFKELVGKLPPDVVITRWKTFLQPTKFYYSHFDKIWKYIDVVLNNNKNKVNKQNSKSPKKEKKRMTRLSSIYDKKDEVRQQLQNVEVIILVDCINILESRHLTITQQVNVIESIRTNKNIMDVEVKDKLLEIINKNKLYLEMLNSVQQCQNKETPNNQDSTKISTSFLQLNIVDVERSFNIFRNVFNMRSTNLSVENINKIMFIRYNAEHFSIEKSDHLLKSRISSSAIDKMVSGVSSDLLDV